MSKLAFIITSSPLKPLTISAINIIEQTIAQGITIVGIFFYQDGVLNASTSIQTPSDEYNCLTAWQQLKQVHNIELHLCITAAEKRGLICEGDNNNIDPAFNISGLGELITLTSQADRVVQL